MRPCHPEGGLPSVERDAALGPVVVDTYAGPVQVEWDPDAAVTSLGHVAFFAEYLKLSGRFDALVADCRLVYSSPNAPAKRDVLGTAVLSIPDTGAMAHITALRGDTVNPSLLGMTRVVSEDAVRRSAWYCGRVVAAWILARSPSDAPSRSSRLRARAAIRAPVATDDEPIVGLDDLGHVAVVEERQLQGSVVDCQRLDGGRPERGDPVQPGRLQIVLDARRDDHPAVADQHHPPRPEAFLELVDLHSQRLRIARFAATYPPGAPPITTTS